jgi:protocatechuate 3,4-dioxygenase beta subunit
MKKLQRFIRFLCRNAAVLGAALCAASTAADAAVTTFHLTDAVSSTPVAGALVIFARENQPGPYEFTTSDEKGSFSIDSDRRGPVLILHPSYRLEELAQPADARLEAGEPVTAPAAIDPHAEIRVYLSSWVGRFDVERLPPLAHASEFRCGGADVLWDVVTRNKSRVITHDLTRTAPVDGELASITIRSGTAGGVVYIAEPPQTKRREDAVPRSRILNDKREATFGDLPRGRRFALVAVPFDGAPVTTFVRTGAAEQSVEVVRSHSPMFAKATVACPTAVGGIGVVTTLRPADVPWLPVRVPALLVRDAVRVNNLAPGTLTLTISAPSRRPLKREALLSSNRTEADLGVMCPPPPFVIAGTVIDAAGRSVRDAVIRYGGATAKSSANGAFALHATAPDEAQLAVTSDGFLPWRTWFQPSDVPSSLTIRLERGSRYRFRVIDAVTKEPLHSFHVSCSGVDGAAPQRLCSEGVIAADGSFTTAPLPTNFSLVMIESPGHELFRKTVTSAEEKTRLRDLGTFEVAPLSALRGRVTDGRARGVAGASVTARSEALPEWDSGVAGVTLFEAATSTEGEFTLPVAEGRYRVRARATGFAESEAAEVITGASVEPVTLQLGPGCGLDVVLHPTPTSSSPRIELHRGSADDQSDMVAHTAGDDGRVRFEHVAAGDYTVVATNGRRLAESEVHVGADQCPDAVDLTIGATRVEGVAAIRGEPVSDASLSLVPAAMVGTPGMTIMRKSANAEGRVTTDEVIGKGAWANATRTDFAGVFAFEDVEPGDYRIVLTRNGDVRSRPLTVGDAAVVEASTDFGERVVPGIVIDGGSSAPIAGAVVTLQNASAAEVDTATTDANGAFTLSDVVGEGLRIVARSEGYDTATAPVDAAPGHAVVTMRRATTTADCLVLHEGLPVPGALVVWQLENGTTLTSGTAYTGAGGSCELRDVGSGILTIAAGTPTFGITFDRTTVTSEPLNRTIELGARTLLRAVLPVRRTARDVRFRYDGTDVTQMVWRFSNGTPILAAESTWVWSGLGPAILDVALDDAARRVTLSAGTVAEVRFGK